MSKSEFDILAENENYLNNMNLDLYFSVLSLGSWNDRKKAFKKAYEFHLCQDIYELGNYVGELAKNELYELSLSGVAASDIHVDVVGLVYSKAADKVSENLNELIGDYVYIELFTNYLDTSFQVDLDDLKERILQGIESKNLSFASFLKGLSQTTLAVFDEIQLDLKELEIELHERSESK